MNKNDKIYVAGHRGMVGSAIVRQLNSLGYNRLILRTSAELDLRRSDEVHDFFQEVRPDYVFLAAAKVGGIMANNTYRADFLYDNLMIQNNVIHAAHVNEVKGLQFMGSSCIYPKMAPQPLKEEYLLTGLLEPTNEPYAIAKISGIKLCDAFKSQYGNNFHSVMPTNLYGPNDNYDLEKSHVLPALIRKFHLAQLLMAADEQAILHDLKIGSGDFPKAVQYLEEHGIEKKENKVVVKLWGSGSPQREFLHVDDLARACVNLMELGLEESFVNVGCGTDLSIRKLAEMVKSIVGFSGEIQWDSSKPDGTPKKLMNVDKVFSTGWKAEISLEEGIESVYKEYKSL